MTRIIHGDCVEAMKAMEPETIDAIVTDPPYGLEFMGKEWDSLTRNLLVPTSKADKERLAEHGDNYAGRPSKAPDLSMSVGDGPKIAEWHRQWAVEALRVLKPGGHLLAFGSPRLYHRLACGIEDAGFEIRDCIRHLHGGLAWSYGSGFPKSMNVGKAMDKAARGVPQGGADPTSANHGKFKGGCTHESPNGRGFGAGPGQFMREAGAAVERELVDEAKAFDGYGTALKPGYEPIVVARKPIRGTVAANVAKFGTGALNIDGSRVAVEAGYEASQASGISSGTDGWDRPWKHDPAARAARAAENAEKTKDLGRWPPNLVLSHSPECVEGGTCADGCPVAEMDIQSGQSESSGRPQTIHRRQHSPSVNPSGIGGIGASVTFENYADAGGASRFFPCFRYEAKPSRGEREAGLREAGLREVGLRTGCAGDMPIDDIGRARDRFEKKARNTHPTVKPVALMAWLVGLVARPTQVVLDPFGGSGTTAIACARLGIECVIIEREAEYVDLIRARVCGDAPLFNMKAPS